MWELDCEESWSLKNWCFWTVVLEKTLESPVDCKEIQSVHSKEYQSCVFIGRADVEADTPVLWPPHVKSWLIGKDPDAWRSWGAGGEGDDREWDGLMVSPTRRACVWVNSGSLWLTGRPAVLWFTGSQGVGHDWMTELNWTELNWEGNGNPLQYSCQEDPRDSWTLWAAVYGVAQSQTRLKGLSSSSRGLVLPCLWFRLFCSSHVPFLVFWYIYFCELLISSGRKLRFLVFIFLILWLVFAL